MSRLSLDGPLAQLNAPAVPLRPVLAVGGVDFDADDEPDGLVRNGRRDPVERRAQRVRVDVGVDAAAREEDEVAEEVGLEDGEGEGLVGLQDLREGGVEVAQQVERDGVGDDFVDEAGVLLGPGGFGWAERLGEVAGRGGVLPGLPDVGGEFGGEVVGEVVG